MNTDIPRELCKQLHDIQYVEYKLPEHHNSTSYNSFSEPFEALTYLWYTSKAWAHDTLEHWFQHCELDPSRWTRLCYWNEEYLTRTYQQPALHRFKIEISSCRVPKTVTLLHEIRNFLSEHQMATQFEKLLYRQAILLSEYHTCESIGREPCGHLNEVVFACAVIYSGLFFFLV